MDDLVTAGKVRYLGISDVPAWKASEAETIADFHGWAPPIAMHVEYSLLARTVEGELLPMAQELGLGVASRAPRLEPPPLFERPGYGKAVSRLNPESEWVIQQVPEKRTIDAISAASAPSLYTTPTSRVSGSGRQKVVRKAGSSSTGRALEVVAWQNGAWCWAPSER